MKSLSLVLVLCVFGTLFAGCADMEFPTPKSVMKDSVGMDANIRRGMSKAEVQNIYGDPTSKRIVTSKEWGGDREEWFYSKKTSLPVGMGYLSKDTYLYFDGVSLTNITDQPIASEKLVASEDDLIK